MNTNSKIYVAGSSGMVGSSIVRSLIKNKFTNIIRTSRKQLNLLNQSEVLNFFKKQKFDFVFLCAARVGGIKDNINNKFQFIYDNLQIQNNIINSAFKTGVQNLIFLGTSCIYPRESKQPIKEEYLLTGPLEMSNQYYSIAKIAGIKLCESLNIQFKTNYLTVMPTNLYGPNDNYDLDNSHVIPALLSKFHFAKKNNLPELVIWGNKNTRREFLHVDDLASACILLMKIKYRKHNIINVGSGEELTIENLANLIKYTVNYDGKILYDKNEPIGTPRKLLNSSKILKTGWCPIINLKMGLKSTYDLEEF